jgi:8-hydroxy-5-deazaflavin:NADPH oxidoreductase
VKIAVIGRGNVGGGLARRWQAAGHDVATFGQDGGDASDAEVIVVAVPSGAIADALSKVGDIAGKPAIDATNAFAGRNEEFDSLAAEVKSIVGGPTAKAFNLNFARAYDEIDEQRVRPSCLYCGDEDAAAVTEQLIRDAGYEPAPAGGLENARALEDFLAPLFAVSQALGGPIFYRYDRPGEL